MYYLMNRILLCGIVVFVLAVVTGGCSKNSLSDRDARLEQIRHQAERKRKELREVVGEYRGEFVFEETEIPTFLKLEIFDVPTPIEGEVDPVMIPVLSGYLHLREPPAHDSFGIESSEYDIKLRKLTLVLKNPTYGNLFVTFSHEEILLSGNWLAPIFGGGGKGTIDLKVVEAEVDNAP